jgi:hypothetical protein
MIERKRTPLSATQRVEVWRRWKAGESLHAIGRALGKDHVVVHLLLKRHGGIAPAPLNSFAVSQKGAVQALNFKTFQQSSTRRPQTSIGSSLSHLRSGRP